MSRYLVITDRESATGFRLGGVDTRVVATPSEAESLLQNVVDRKEAGLVLINQQYMDHLSDSFQRKLERLSLPLVIPIPISGTWWQETPTDDYIFKLIRRAIGYQMKIKKA